MTLTPSEVFFLILFLFNSVLEIKKIVFLSNLSNFSNRILNWKKTFYELGFENIKT